MASANERIISHSRYPPRHPHRHTMQTYPCSYPAHGDDVSAGSRTPALTAGGLDDFDYYRPPVFVLGQWLVCGCERAIWLPPQYSADVLTTAEGTVAIGHNNGRVTIIGFDESSLPSEPLFSPPYFFARRRSLLRRFSSEVCFVPPPPAPSPPPNRPSIMQKLLPGWARSRRMSGQTTSSSCSPQDNERPLPL